MENPRSKILLIIVMCLVGSFVAGIISLIYLLTGGGLTMAEIQTNGINMDRLSSNEMRGLTIVNHLFTFIVPAFLFATLFYKNEIAKYFTLDRWPKTIVVLLGIVGVFACLPLVQLSFHMNEAIELPSWMTSLEADASKTVEKILAMDNIGLLLVNLLIISVLPGIGEELIFRGIIQKELAKKINPFVAIFIAAFLFSLMHMQFEGFLPRLVLGAVLGLLYYWSGSLWIPILAHMANNAAQVLMLYFMDDFNLEDINSAPQTNFLYVVGSLIALYGIYYLMKMFRNEGEYA